MGCYSKILLIWEEWDGVLRIVKSWHYRIMRNEFLLHSWVTWAGNHLQPLLLSHGASCQQLVVGSRTGHWVCFCGPFAVSDHQWKCCLVRDSGGIWPFLSNMSLISMKATLAWGHYPPFSQLTYPDQTSKGLEGRCKKWFYWWVSDLSLSHSSSYFCTLLVSALKSFPLGNFYSYRVLQTPVALVLVAKLDWFWTGRGGSRRCEQKKTLD